jgi:hypothetical protein
MLCNGMNYHYTCDRPHFDSHLLKASNLRETQTGDAQCRLSGGATDRCYELIMTELMSTYFRRKAADCAATPVLTTKGGAKYV